MVKELIHDPILLSRVSEPALKEDWAVAQDLLETLIFHEKGFSSPFQRCFHVRMYTMIRRRRTNVNLAD